MEREEEEERAREQEKRRKERKEEKQKIKKKIKLCMEREQEKDRDFLIEDWLFQIKRDTGSGRVDQARGFGRVWKDSVGQGEGNELREEREAVETKTKG